MDASGAAAGSGASSEDPRLGQVLRGKWRLDALLGTGGMASVYAATHRNGRRGAVKVLHPAMAANPEVRARFLREGYVANKVDHPGAVVVLDDDEAEDGTVFLVMELLDGQSVHAYARARPGGKLEAREVCVIGDRLLDVLIRAHEKGIVHRDLKPENLFLTRGEELKVLDFGIARLLDPSGSAHATKAGSLYGTPAFMPPEQARGLWDQVDARTDLWAAGATLFALLTGHEVHGAARTVNEQLLAAMTESAPLIASLVELPPPIAGVVDRALAFDASHRWPDARAMQAALRDAHRAAFGADIHATLSGALATPVLSSLLPPPAASDIRHEPDVRHELNAPDAPNAIGATFSATAAPAGGLRPHRARPARWIWGASVVAVAAAGVLATVLLIGRSKDETAASGSASAAPSPNVLESSSSPVIEVLPAVSAPPPAPSEPASSASPAPQVAPPVASAPRTPTRRTTVSKRPPSSGSGATKPFTPPALER